MPRIGSRALRWKDFPLLRIILVSCMRAVGVFRKTTTTAVAWYRKAAAQHYAPAESNLGFMYLQGRGVPADSKEAAKLFRQAAKTSDAAAQYNLGLLYYLGSGVKQDSGLAAKFFHAAAAAGSREAQSAIGSLLSPAKEVSLLAP